MDFDKNFRTCQKITKLQITRFLGICGLRGPVSGKYSGLVIRNVQTQELLVASDENFRPFQKWNKLHVTIFFAVSGLPDQYPVNIPDL